ncbi:MAG: aminopeptidase [Rectinemataceae bacterium]
MYDERCDRLARLIAEWSLGVREGQRIIVKGPDSAKPLMLALAKAIYGRGAFPWFQVAFAESEEIAFRHASDAVLAQPCELDSLAVEKFDGLLLIMGEENPRAHSRVDPARRAMALNAAMPSRNAVMRRAAEGSFSWAAVVWPTAGYANEATMSIMDFEDAVFGASLPAGKDPVGHWRGVGERQAASIAALAGAREVRIEAEDTDLRLSVEGRRWDNGCCRHNLPDGEIYTGPVEDSAEGRIYFPGRVLYKGGEARGIRLRFEKGLVIEATAAQGQEFLLGMLDSDPSARRLGEFAFGMNDGIKELCGQILLDEKAGGTMHIALGNGYPQTGSKNRSALHWDLVLDTRAGGRVSVDGKVALENGQYRI